MQKLFNECNKKISIRFESRDWEEVPWLEMMMTMNIRPLGGAHLITLGSKQGTRQRERNDQNEINGRSVRNNFASEGEG